MLVAHLLRFSHRTHALLDLLLNAKLNGEFQDFF
jgi:hypothetical protein